MRTLTTLLFAGICGLSCGLWLEAGCGAPLGDAGEAPVDETTVAATALPVPGTARVTASSLNLRAGPGTGYSVLAVMPGGATVDVIAGPSGSFYNVRYGTTTGWAHGSYLQAVSGGGGGGGGGTPWRPRPGTSWQWQLTGTIDTSLNVQMYDVDLFTTPQSVIDTLHGRGRVVICYFSAGTYEPGRPDSADLPPSVRGRVLPDWPDERWLDIRSSVVRGVMRARLDRARGRGCDGVEPDNVDGYDNQNGFSLTAAQQLDYNRFLAREAHARGLSVGLKNDLGQVRALAPDFDWALNEQCFQYDECDALQPFLDAGKAVFEVEYGGASLAGRICPQANRQNLDTLIKDLDLTAFRVACR